MVRHLLWRATELDCLDVDGALSSLEQVKDAWLETGDGEYEGKVPAIIIDNERRRLRSLSMMIAGTFPSYSPSPVSSQASLTCSRLLRAPSTSRQSSSVARQSR